MRKAFQIVFEFLIIVAVLSCPITIHAEDHPPVLTSDAPIHQKNETPEIDLPEKVIIATSEGSAPFHFADSSGKPAGMIVDLWKLWSKVTGVRVEFQISPWNGTIEQVREGNADIHAGILISLEREKFLDFGDPLYKNDTHFFYHKSILEINHYKDLIPFKIGIIEGDLALEFFHRQLPQATFTIFPDNQSLFDAIERGEIKVFVKDTPIAIYHLSKRRLYSSFKYHSARPLYSNSFYPAVKKGNTRIMAIIQKGMKAISREEKAEIQRNWMGVSETNTSDILTIALVENFLPFSGLDYAGKPTGLLVDIWRLWSKKTGQEIEFKVGNKKQSQIMVDKYEADIHGGLFSVKGLEDQMIFSQPFYKTISNMYCDLKSDFDDVTEGSKGKQLGIVNDSVFSDHLQEKYPKMELKSYPGYQDMIKATLSGDIRCFHFNGPVSLETLDQLGATGQLKKEAGSLVVNDIRAAAKKTDPLLLKTINSGLGQITNIELMEIEKRWLPLSENRQIKKHSLRHETLSERERNWLAVHRQITIAFDGDYAPYSYLNKEGQFEGIAVDMAQELADRIGISLNTYPEGNWKKLYAAALNRNVDVIATLVELPERKRWFEFTQPYFSLAFYIITRQDNEDINERSDINNKSIALVEGYSTTSSILEEFSTIKPVMVKSLTESLEAVSSGKADVTIASMGMAQYLISQKGMDNLKFAVLFDQGKSKQGFGVRGDWPELSSLFDKAMQSLSDKERLQIFQRWSHLRIAEMEVVKSQTVIPLSEAEKAWLKDHKTIRLGVDPYWPPFDYIDKDGKTHKGMAADFVQLLSTRLGVVFELNLTSSWGEVIDKAKNREIDVIASLVETDSRKKFLKFSDPYLSFPWVIITRNDFDFIGSIEDLLGKRVAVISQYATHERLLNEYPEISPATYSEPLKALMAVSTGKEDAYIGNLVATSFLIEQHNLANLKVAAPTGFSEDMDQLRLGVRKDWPILVSILNKGLNSITDKERTGIKQKWFSVRFEHGIDAAYIRTIAIRVAVAFSVILAVILIWNRRLKREINRRLKVEKDLLEARDAAEAANRAKTVFLSSMSHEIRTPMNAILGFSQIMLRDPTITEDQKENIRTIWRSGEHLLNLINDILEMSKIEAGRLSLSLESFDLHSLLKDLEMIFRVRTDAKSIRLTVDYSKQVPQFIKADPDKLKQILINLLGNAVKFTEEGGIVLRVDTAKDLPVLRFEVEDTGPGIPEDALGKIFLQFEQTSEGGKISGGTGLGLAISQKYAELMKGYISATSKQGEGSLFHFKLPFEQADLNNIVSRDPKDRVLRVKSGQDSIRILIVDDQEANRTLMQKSLSEIGFIVEEAINGLDAIAKFKVFYPHLILMDIVMPVMDGIKATEEIKKLPGGQEVVVFAVTASVLEGEKERIFASGAAEFIRKPFREADLFQKIEQHLGIEFEFENRKAQHEKVAVDKLSIVPSKPEMISKLPTELATRLEYAVSNGYIDQIYGIIHEIEKVNKETATQLTLLAEQYDYKKILDHLKQT
jgi:ABC-type amino acid transport substrate-binding protein/CheY-like chemotaxis protein